MIKFADKHCGECCMNAELMGTSSGLGSRSCVRLGSRVGEHFEVRKGLRQEYVMFPWLFNIYFDKVTRQVNKKGMGKGVKLRDENGMVLRN